MLNLVNNLFKTAVQERSLLIYLWLLVLSIIIIFLLFATTRMRKQHFTPNNNNNNDKYTKNIIKYSAIFGIVSIISIVIYELFFSKSIPTDNYAEKLLDMQSITLAITGISISLISIISTVLTARREEKYEKVENAVKENINELKEEKDKLESSVKELNNMHQKLKDGSNALSRLLLIESIFLENRKEKLLFTLSSTTESFFDKYFYITNLHKNSSGNAPEETKRMWYQSIIEQGEQLLSPDVKYDISIDYEKTRKYMVLIILADAYYYIGESKTINNDNCKDADIEEAFNKSEEYLKEADFLYPDEDGYITNSRGLMMFGKYKYYFSKGEIKQDLLDNSIIYYEKAIQKNPIIPQYHNNKGVSLLHKAKHEKKPSEYWDNANKCFREALHLNKHSSKAALNIAAICIDKIRLQLGIEKEIIILQNSTLLNCDKKTFYNNYKRAKSYLNNAMSIEPHFIDSYYKKAQLYMYLLFFKEKTNDLKSEEKENICEKIECLFEDCKDINPDNRAVYYIKRMYYDVKNDFESACEINEKIKLFNPNNSNEWEKCYNIFRGK